MKDHSECAERLPLYVSGVLAEAERREMENHLADCVTCQSDLALWEEVARQVVASNQGLVAPTALVDRALQKVRGRQATGNVFVRALQLIRAQAPLVHGEIWPASAAVMTIGVIAATIVKDVAILRMLAPMVAAASIAVIHGPENDPARELTYATATSPWKILLARLTLVFGYDLLLALAASLGMLMLLPSETLVGLILDWLAPMTFLSAAALVLALWMGTGNAILVTYLAWLLRLLPYQQVSKSLGFVDHSVFLGFLDSYQQFWTSPPILVALAVVLVGIAAGLAGQSERHLPHWA